MKLITLGLIYTGSLIQMSVFCAASRANFTLQRQHLGEIVPWHCQGTDRHGIAMAHPLPLLRVNSLNHKLAAAKAKALYGLIWR